jgi:Gas vesicle protein
MRHPPPNPALLLANADDFGSGGGAAAFHLSVRSRTPIRSKEYTLMSDRALTHSVQTASLADILERVLDKGIVIAGDITISLADVELLNIKIRLLVASVDKAREIGINWWQSDPTLSSHARELQMENQLLHERLDRLESRLAANT